MFLGRVEGGPVPKSTVQGGCCQRSLKAEEKPGGRVRKETTGVQFDPPVCHCPRSKVSKIIIHFTPEIHTHWTLDLRSLLDAYFSADLQSWRHANSAWL